MKAILLSEFVAVNPDIWARIVNVLSCVKDDCDIRRDDGYNYKLVANILSDIQHQIEIGQILL